MKQKMLVVGTTGTVGRDVVRLLLETGYEVRVLARDPARAGSVFGSDVEIVRGDLRDRASLRAAVRGVEVASLATAPSPGIGEEEGAFIDVAKDANVRRIVKLSGFGIEFATDSIHLGHASSDARLRASGVPAVVLRPLIYMSNMLMDVEAIRAGKLPSVFGDARVNFVDPLDVAELTVQALVDSRHEGQTWEFGGPEALSYRELASTFTRILGRPIERMDLSLDTFEAAARSTGVPEFVIEAVMGASEAARSGKYSRATDDVVQRVLGRRGSTFEHWLVRHQDAFRVGRWPHRST